ncbi:MAG: hypothetical protein V3G42_08630 [Oscillospiraceae bacterium]
MKNRKFLRRLTSALTAFAVVATSIPLSPMTFINFDLSFLHVKAEDAPSIDLATLEEKFFLKDTNGEFILDGNDNKQPNHNPNFKTVDEFIEYCYCYREDSQFADEHEEDAIEAPFTNDGAGKYIKSQSESGCDFTGLGTEAHPFKGSILFDSGGTSTYTLPMDDAPLFSYVCDNVELKYAGGVLTTIQMERRSQMPVGTNSPIFAQHVVDDGTATAANWGIEILSSNERKYSGVIGEIGQNAEVTLRLTNHCAMEIISNASDDESDTILDDVPDIGMICGKMSAASKLDVTYSSDAVYTVTSENGNAGMLVGTMENGASLTISGLTAGAIANVTSTNGYAGGLVGELTSAETVVISATSAIPVNSDVTGALGAGGLFGHYTNVSTAEFDLEKYNVTATVEGEYCGGLFGVLENQKGNLETALSLTFKNTNNAGTISANSSETGNATGYFGGIAGKYVTDDLKNSLILNALTITANAQATYGAFGGAIGLVDSAAYVQSTGTVTVNATGTSTATCFGGLIGATSATNGVFVDLENFTLNTGSEQFNGGGIVGQFKNGVLRLCGTTDMTNGKPASATNCGQLVGKNDNVLVYAPSDGNWIFKRASGASTDDLGTWGEVVRGIADTADTNTIYFNSTNHTATIAAAETTIDSVDDFARTALNIQLNQGSDYGCLLFVKDTSTGAVATANTRATLLGNPLTIGADIDLSGTGINGFMRDGGDVGTLGAFTSTLDGAKSDDTYKITLAIGEKYGYEITDSTAAEGVGQIYRHQHNGLFSVLAGTVSNLTVDGTINVSNCVDGMNIGGIASRNSGNVTLTKVIANETVNYNESSKVAVTGEGKNIGGYIGYVGTNGNITINGVSSIGAKFNLSGSHEMWNVYGGAIGKITAGTFTVNIGTKDDTNNKLTDSLTTSITGISAVGLNGDGGGLIGHITNAGSYSSRQVNLNNLAISGCTIGNAASTNGGGFFGYSWLNTTTNINGVTASGTIDNSAASNVGIMLYSSTGKMVVNSLAINGLTMSSGGSYSLGMIVNKAYTVNDKNELTGALYLDVLNAGYGLNCTAPSSANGIFDEIAAYSAPDIINGGAGVISINMNTSREGTEVTPEGGTATTQKLVKITETGTYQNQLKTGDACANPNSRYYYNIDNMSSSNAGQNLVLWSLSKYAYSGISAEFISGKGSDTTFGTTLDKSLSGAADMTGLSFYPLVSANENYTIGNMTLTLDYSGLYGTAETVSNTDSYVRDPAAANQHYLMHSGLFINQPSGNSLTVTGKLSLAGTFMEDSTHQGVIMSGTMKGTFLCDTGSIELDGIKPMNGANAYTAGYLLINNISRTNDLETPPSVTIKNLSNTDKYSSTAGSAYSSSGTTANVAKSLIGKASGKGLTIIFSKIKLDGRDKTKSDSNLKASELYAAYKTYNSIFSTSTLLAEINTDQSSKLEYNFTKAHDWGTNSPREVTYGAEIKNSKEYKDEEQRYYPDAEGQNKDYVNPIDSSTRTDDQGVYDFTVGFLPYVKTTYNNTDVDANGCFKRELKVNVLSVALSIGCGTYNDPYQIDDGKVLEAVAKFIATGDTADLKEVVLPKSPDSDDIISGNRWDTGTDYHATFKASGTNYVSDSYTWTGSNARKYLASAYYMITADLELSSNYLGLGYASESANATNPAIGDYAFRGVIIGADVPDSDAENAPTHKASITNGSKYPFINVSNGSVVKDLNIIVPSNIELSQANATYDTAFFGYYHQCMYYGGIFGEVMGGDNIIDNSYVIYSNSKITLSGSKATIVPVGGYVGVVVFGGVIFKNMTATTSAAATELKVNNSELNVIYTGKAENLADNNKQEDWAAIYVNPIVGRVINGYAVNENTRFSTSENGKYHDNAGFNTGKTRADTVIHTLKNGTKHYSIADINKDETNKLDVSAVPTSTSSDGTINIPNAQAFFILSLITQSCAGTAQGASTDYVNSLSYGTNTTVYGMSRNADYTNVGSATDSTDSDFVLAGNDTTLNSATPYIIDRYCTNHNARCVTSTNGYYDINLNAKTTYSVSSYTYKLPDSFRGVGCVGNYNDQYKIRVDQVNGNNCIIDEDIYLNKFATDNYFNKLHNGTSQSTSGDVVDYNVNHGLQNHGIGLFDSIQTKDSGVIKNIILSGSLNTEIYKDGYNTSAQKTNLPGNNNARFLSVGGICGTVLNPYNVNFEQITLDMFTASGSSIVGGLLGFSGINQDSSAEIHITKCGAKNLSVKMTSSSASESTNKSRNAIGGLVGKCFEGKVKIYGTYLDSGNNDLNSFSTVEFDGFSFGNEDGDYMTAAGGLVGFAGDGCQAYDMKIISSNSSTPIKIGANKIRFVGGICGLMQSAKDGTKYNPYTPTCYAIFKNCTVENINLKGQFVGGFYGGKWGETGWTTYSIDIDNCKVKGNTTTNNTIETVKPYSGEGEYAGGFVGRGLVLENGSPNISIKNSTVSNYTITGQYCGGFIGYAGSYKSDSSITCYIHDSSVENCIIGKGTNYAGGAIGQVARRSSNSTNKILGYNIKLDNVTSNSSNMGAWIGYVDTADNTTSIQFSGMAIYGSGFDKNIGNWTVANNQANKNASFVFADYTGKCKGTQTTDLDTNEITINYPTDISGFNYSDSTHVEMPKYPYVNINPQSDIGADEIVSSDGAVLYGSSVTDFSGKTGDKTMAAKIYSELSDTTNTRRYTTFVDTAIKNTNKIDYYMKHTPGEDGTRISTYFAEKGYTQSTAPEGVEDFVVIVINSSDNDETTELINRYIQLVTNTNTDYTEYKYRDSNNPDPYIHIDVKPCEYKKGKFQVMSTGQAGLRLGTKAKNVDGNDVDYTQFQLVSSDADEANQFTLIDVQFKDPFDSNKIAYHLYVPVYTIKQIEVKFYASAMTGSSSVSNPRSSDYISLMRESGRGTLIDSLDTWVTQYIRYQYNGEDINSLLSEGNVKWNYDKKVTFVNQQSGYTLPDNTFMVLVDPNGDRDKMYYANGITGFAKQASEVANGQNDLIVELNKFTRLETTDEGNNTRNVPFSVQNLNVLIASSISEASGTTYTIGDASDYDVYRTYTENGVKKTAYYKYSATGNGTVDLTVPTNSTFDEDYYISMFVPTPTNYTEETDIESVKIPAYRLFYYEITPPTELTGTRKAVLTTKYTYNMMIANLFEQDTSLTYNVSTATDERQITESNDTLFVDAKCKITLKNENARVHLSGRSLYHAVNIMLNRYETTGVTNDIQGLGNVTAKYTINGDIGDNSPSCVIDEERAAYLNVRTADVLSYITNASNESRSVQIAAKVTIPFTNIDLEFPPGNSIDTEIGVNVASTSNLSYYPDKLAYTSMTEPFPSSPNYYYIEDINNAVLDYNTVDMIDQEDTIGGKSFNYSRIGINGRTDSATKEWMSIPTKADYNISAIENTENADKLRVVMYLEKKSNTTENGVITGAEYQPIINLDDYMTIESVTTGTDNENSFTKKEVLDGNAANNTPEKVVYEIDQPSVNCTHLDGDIGYTFNINVKAKTGSGFTEYANYRIRLEVELIDTVVDESGTAIDKSIDNSNAKNWLVYTNAKVYPSAFDKLQTP